MLVTGDLKCLHCGFISGRWVGQQGAALRGTGLRAARGGQDPTESAEEVLRCRRCEGPLILDDVAPVISPTRLRRIRRLREQIAAFDRRAPNPAA